MGGRVAQVVEHFSIFIHKYIIFPGAGGYKEKANEDECSRDPI
jgi:hypothetical protein